MIRSILRISSGLTLFALLASCSSDARLPFAAFGSERAFSSNKAATQVSFANGGVQLVAPKGFCIDKSWIRRTKQTGFALMARCDMLGSPGRHSNRAPAVITATIGPLSSQGTAPTLDQLAKVAPGANLLQSRDDLMLPLVQLDHGDHGVPGAAPQHWRGGFALNNHLLALALYAPEGNVNLTDQGAFLLNDLTRRTLEASLQLDDPTVMETRQRTTGLRPRARPMAGGTASQEDIDPPAEKNWLLRGIAGLFD